MKCINKVNSKGKFVALIYVLSHSLFFLILTFLHVLGGNAIAISLINSVVIIISVLAVTLGPVLACIKKRGKDRKGLSANEFILTNKQKISVLILFICLFVFILLITICCLWRGLPPPPPPSPFSTPTYAPTPLATSTQSPVCIIYYRSKEKLDAILSPETIENALGAKPTGFSIEAWIEVEDENLYVRLEYAKSTKVTLDPGSTSGHAFIMPKAQTGIRLKQPGIVSVYTGPGGDYYRNGRASVDTSSTVSIIAFDKNSYGEEWVLIEYKTSGTKTAPESRRRGYISADLLASPTVKHIDLPKANRAAKLKANAGLYDDLSKKRDRVSKVLTGTSVTFLAEEDYETIRWAYIEFELNGQIARGFVEYNTLHFDE